MISDIYSILVTWLKLVFKVCRYLKNHKLSQRSTQYCFMGEGVEMKKLNFNSIIEMNTDNLSNRSGVFIKGN